MTSAAPALAPAGRPGCELTQPGELAQRGELVVWHAPVDSFAKYGVIAACSHEAGEFITTF